MMLTLVGNLFLVEAFQHCNDDKRKKYHSEHSLLRWISTRFYAILLSVENAFPVGPKPLGTPQPPLRKTQLTSVFSAVTLRDV